MNGHRFSRQALRGTVVCGLLCALTTPLHAAQDPAAPPGLVDLSLEELINLDISTASKTLEKQSDAPAIVEVLTRDELKRFGGTTLKDVLTRVPGLVAVSGYFTDRSMIGFPGDALQAPTSRHVLLLINGRPVREVQEGGIKTAMLEAFPLDAIARIEVVKGPGSVLYGSEAFAGVLNIITTTPERNGLSVLASKGTGGAHGTMGTATIAQGDFSALVSGRAWQASNWVTPYTMDNGSTRKTIDLAIPNDTDGAFVNVRYKKLSVMASTDHTASSFFSQPFQVAGDVRWRHIFTDTGYGFAVSDRWSMNVNLTYNQSLLNVPRNVFPYISRDSRQVLGEVSSVVTLSDKARIVVGGTTERTSGLEDMLDSTIIVSKGRRTGYAGYAQGDYQLFKQVKVVGGFQANKISNTDLAVVPRAGVIWHPAPKATIKVLYGEAFRAPYINELHVDHPGLRGNPDVKPEFVRAINAEGTYVAANLELAVRYFDNRQRDNIFEILHPGQTQQHVENAGMANIRGVESAAKYYVSKTVFVTGSWLFQRSNDGRGQQDITNVANVGAKAGISYRSDAGSLGLFDVYQGDVSDRWRATVNPQAGPYHMVSMYGTLDLKKVLRMDGSREISLVLQADNLLDTNLWVPSLGNPAIDTVPVSPGRSTYVGLRFGL